MTDLVKEYKKYKLSSNDIINFLKEVKTSSNEDRINKCKNAIVMANIGLIIKVMKPYIKFKNISQNDMINEGILGIYCAIDKFDITKNNQFSTYAFFWIKQKIQRFVEKNCMNKLDMSSISIDSTIDGNDDDDDRKIGDTIKAKPMSDVIINSEIKSVINEMFNVLNYKEKFLIKARFGI